jgi:phospholipase C
MENRRGFIKKAAMLAGGTGFHGILPASIQKALAIDPRLGSTWADAEHIVLLMQENRSFDHCFGTLRGVRGFNDPRAIDLPNKNRVWLQTNESGETYTPFRVDLHGSKATWLGGLPHSWTDQVDAANKGKHDKWLEAKKTGTKEILHSPWTMAYYTRADLPFYYAMADAFTVCDQNFCSSLTGTTPNRLYFWTGTIREEQKMESRANVLNDNVDYPSPAKWTTFPERLEEHGISWKIYQNEISLDSGLEDEYDAWLTNFTDNPIEWFEQYQVKFHAGYQAWLQKLLVSLPGEIQTLEGRLEANATLSEKERDELHHSLQEKKDLLATAAADTKKYSAQEFDQLSDNAKDLHRKAFTTNRDAPDYRELETHRYRDGDADREMVVPKGDVLHQFREDVKHNRLPTVSWLVAPEHFSDHAGTPWYGSWYTSEVLDILTENPEVWKKTIFILTYDENDGLFDHIPPFNPPYQQGTGRVSEGIDTSVEHVSKELEMKYKDPTHCRDNSIGLGFRVPMVIASPWSRGGYVNSEVFDHTSTLQFLEKFLQAKFGKQLSETNITAWRRTVCGDLTSTFRTWDGEKIQLPVFLEKDTVLEDINKARFRELPVFHHLSEAEIDQVNANPATASVMPVQEKGIRPAAPLPYELYADGGYDPARKAFGIRMGAGNAFFGKASVGAPFKVYAPGNYTAFDKTLHGVGFEAARSWNYAVKAGDQLEEVWPFEEFRDGYYHLRVYGPNGFFREFSGDEQDPAIDIRCSYEHEGKSPTGRLELHFRNLDSRSQTLEIVDKAYDRGSKTQTLAGAGHPGSQKILVLDLSASHHWYDVRVGVKGFDRFEKRYAGHVETGRASFSDPYMGRV